MYEINSTPPMTTRTKLSHFTQCQSFICHFSIEVSLQNIQTGRMKTMKIAEMIIIAYQKFFMYNPAESLTFETSKGIMRSIV